MSIPSHPPGLLDQLRVQSDSLRAKDGGAHQPAEDAMREIDRELWKAFRWLEEAMHHLEVIQPRVEHSFSLPGVLTIKSPRYERGFTSYRRRAVAGMELLQHVEMFYRLTTDSPVIVKVQPGVATSIEERLRAAQLQFRYNTEQDEARVVRYGVFTVTPAITACVRLVPDYGRQRIEVTLRNIDRFESVILDFAGDALDEPALEDLLRFILGENNQFLRRAPLAGMGAQRHDAVLANAAKRASGHKAA
ncbi:MAG: hypothetical protein ABJC33_02750 [Betaproteobacteria bacterium]